MSDDAPQTTVIASVTIKRLEALRERADELQRFHPDGTVHVPAVMLMTLIDILLNERASKNG